MNTKNAKKNKYGHVIVKSLIDYEGITKGKLYSGYVDIFKATHFNNDYDEDHVFVEGEYELIHDYTYPVMIGEECEFWDNGEWTKGRLESVTIKSNGIHFTCSCYPNKYFEITSQIRPITPPKPLENYTKEELIARVRELENG